MKLLEDIQKQIQKSFKLESEEATRMNFEDFVENRESGRILRCVLFLAEGSLERLRYYIEVVNTDYRDVIFWAEYVDLKSEQPRRVRDFNRPFGRHEISSDD